VGPRAGLDTEARASVSHPATLSVCQAVALLDASKETGLEVNLENIVSVR
jgi:hypothetical protein